MSALSKNNSGKILICNFSKEKTVLKSVPNIELGNPGTVEESTNIKIENISAYKLIIEDEFFDISAISSVMAPLSPNQVK